MLKNKRIILAVTNDLTHDRRMHRICRSLVEAGAEVILVGRWLPNSKEYSPLGFTGLRLKCRKNKGPWFYAEYNRRLLSYLMKTNFDIACACDLDTALAVQMACKLKGKKSVYDAHEYFIEVPELIGRPVVKKAWDTIGHMTIPRFNLRYTVGEELAELMGKKYNAEFQVIRNISPLHLSENIPLPIEKRERIIFYQGALNMGRGLEACIEAMSKLPDWQFWLAGEGDITNELKELSQKLKLEDRVKFLGWVDPDHLSTLLYQAKLGVNLLERNSLSYYYSLPNKFFDCIQAGLPSINMNYPEYIRINQKYDCSILVDEVSPEKIVSTIHYLEQNPQILIDMSNACKEAAKEFTWEKESMKLVKMYESIID